MQTLKAPKNILIVKPVAKPKDPTKMTKEEYFAMLDESRAQYDRGEYKTLKYEDIRSFIENL